MEITPNNIYLGDCMELMNHIPAASIDLILCDLPYGITDCQWDKKLPPDAVFRAYNRLIKENGAIVLTATCKFGYELINANRKNFRYDLVWEKSMAVGFANANRQPMRAHELILVFYKKQPTYNPQGLIAIENPKMQIKHHTKKSVYKDDTLSKPYMPKYTNYPRSVLRFPNNNHGSVHPTQKPIALFEYLVNTYSNPGDVVLDNCIGSGTTAVACINTERQFIGMESDKGYYEVACGRVAEAVERKVIVG